MTLTMKRKGICGIVFMTMLVIWGIACRRSPTEPAPIPQPQLGYTLFIVRVLDNTNVGVNNASIEISGTVSHQVFTDSSGTVNTQLPYGSYNVSTAPFGFDGSSKAIELDSPNEELNFNLTRKDELRIINISPVCGSQDVPYGFNSVKVEVEYSLTQKYPYPYLAFVWVALSNDDTKLIDNTSGGSGVSPASPSGGSGTTIVRTGLMEYNRGKLNKTLFIVIKLVKADINFPGVDLELLDKEIKVCEFGYQ